MRSLLVFLLLLFLALAAPLANNYVETPDHMANGTVYSISHLFPKVFMKTDEFEINYEMCVQYRYNLMERKVKLRAYTCLMSEGGFCVLDQWSYPNNTSDCSYLRPWTFNKDRYTFYFMLERRPRRFGPRSKLRRRVGKRQEMLSARPIGSLQIDGMVPCPKVCNYKKNRPY